MDNLFMLNDRGEFVSNEKLTPSILYTSEAEESKQKTEDELEIEDPDIAEAKKIIDANLSEDA